MPKLQSNHTYQATLRDTDNQILSTGGALFHIDVLQGGFWPHDGANEDLLLKNATSVQTLEGHKIVLNYSCDAEHFTRFIPTFFQVHFEICSLGWNTGINVVAYRIQFLFLPAIPVTLGLGRTPPS